MFPHLMIEKTWFPSVFLYIVIHHTVEAFILGPEVNTLPVFQEFIQECIIFSLNGGGLLFELLVSEIR